MFVCLCVCLFFNDVQVSQLPVPTSASRHNGRSSRFIMETQILFIHFNRFCTPVTFSLLVFSPSELDVKLTGGSHNFQGFLQVYNNSEWHLVCPEEWNRDAADLVCKKLGNFIKMHSFSLNYS